MQYLYISVQTTIDYKVNLFIVSVMQCVFSALDYKIFAAISHCLLLIVMPRITLLRVLQSSVQLFILLLVLYGIGPQRNNTVSLVCLKVFCYTIKILVKKWDMLYRKIIGVTVKLELLATRIYVRCLEAYCHRTCDIGTHE